MTFLSKYIIVLFFMGYAQSFASVLIIPMDDTQTNHLKSYGLVYWVLQKEEKVKWLLNYKGGAFLIEDTAINSKECKIRGISFETLSNEELTGILKEINSPSKNQSQVTLEKAPKIAVYSPEGHLPWDDAVTLALTYAEIPYTSIYDKEILSDALNLYDWLHLHHEDFTGQYGKFYGSYKSTPWYINNKKQAEQMAKELGYNKVSQEKLAVANKIKDYIVGGGFMFAMCSATDSFDIALAADGVDICETMFDGDGTTLDYQSQINYQNTFAFTNFILERNPYTYEFSDVDTTSKRFVKKDVDYFELMEYSAKWDPIPTMLCQNHTSIIKGFMGQTTSFSMKNIKPNTYVMGLNKEAKEAKYIHGVKGKGFFTFYGGHDPEDYQHRVGDPKTELELHPNSPGYRLILNNILFPAARKQEKKT